MAVAVQSSPIVIGNNEAVEDTREEERTKGRGSKGEVKFNLGEASPQRTVSPRVSETAQTKRKRRLKGREHLHHVT